VEGRGSEQFRALLVADLALQRGVAKARDVAMALQRFWEGDAEDLADELARLAGLDASALGPVLEEVERRIGEAGGDAQAALLRQGGLDRSIHLALGNDDAALTRALTRLGAPVRAPLRPLPDDRYVAFEPVGEGGMGVVYLALDTELNRRVAFKMVRPDAGTAPAEKRSTPASPTDARPPPRDTGAAQTFEELKSRFLQEAWVTGGLEHPGIVPVYELGKTPQGVPYYTMRFVRGQRTLAQAIDELREKTWDERLALLEPFLKLCDTVRYAHSKGVVHRDLKPDNVALGEYGEVVLLDWGLAKSEDREDLTGSLWQQKIEEFRKATDMQTVAGVLGTPGYMAPEAALGQVAQVDRRSDVYSLGAILFEVLTGRLPFRFESFVECVRQLSSEDAPEARSLDEGVPQALSDLCARALSREKKERPESAEALAQEVRSWQAQSALEKEVEGLLRDAKAALDAAAEAHGEARLRQVDRAAGALERVAARQSDNPTALRYRKRASSLREEGIRERERASGRRVLVRVAAAVLVLATVAGFVVAGVLNQRRREAETAREEAERARGEATAALGREQEARKETEQALAAEEEARKKTAAALAREEEAREATAKERDAKARALAEVLRLADAKKVRDLLDGLDTLWPVHPDRAPAMAEWLARAEAVVANRPGHEEAIAKVRERAEPYAEEQRLEDHAAEIERLAELRKALAESEPPEEEAEKAAWEERVATARKEVEQLEGQVAERGSWSFASEEDDWRHQVLSDLLEGIDRLAAVREQVRQRHEAARTLEARSIEAHRAKWDATIEAIGKSPKYGGLKLAPQVGLVPLGPDPDSGLFEFAVLDTGAIPERDPETKRLALTDDVAVVLVLIPGGTFKMGAQKEDPEAANFDPQAEGNESPVHEVTLSPYFVAKHECTQAQWEKLSGETPSRYGPGNEYGGKKVTLRHPVEQVSWEDGTRWLSRFNLELPAEAQWEFACRAGTDTPWWCGKEAAALAEAANVADAFCKANGGPASWNYEEWDDGFVAHAPVGSFRPNAFGLFDVHGNVWEWCRDTFKGYPSEPATDPVVQGAGNRVSRGGGWNYVASYARCANRYAYDPSLRSNSLGVRPARSVTSE